MKITIFNRYIMVNQLYFYGSLSKAMGNYQRVYKLVKQRLLYSIFLVGIANSTKQANGMERWYFSWAHMNQFWDSACFSWVDGSDLDRNVHEWLGGAIQASVL